MIQKHGVFLAYDAGRFVLVGYVLEANVAALALAEDAGHHALVAEDAAAQQAEGEVFERIRERAHAARAHLHEDDFREFSGLRHVRVPLQRFLQELIVLNNSYPSLCALLLYDYMGFLSMLFCSA
jgi:hypothetical protein